MNPLILNRAFQHPADGWYQIEPKGEHPARSAGLIQVIDDDAAAAIVNRFNADAASGRLSHGHEMLIDHEHFKHDIDQETRAYGWLQQLQNRADGIYGQIRWTGTGKRAVDDGDYRFFSTEYDPADLKILNDDKSRSARRVRPVRLDGLTLTNNPNNKGGRPITNRAAPVAGCCPDCGKTFASASAPADSTNETKTQNRKMKTVYTLLGLSAEADEASVHAAVSKLLNRADTTPADLTTLKTRVTALETENQALMADQVDGILAQCKITDAKVINRLKPILTPLKNRQERMDCLTELLGIKPGETAQPPAASTQTKLFNRDQKKPSPETKAGETALPDRAAADKIMNRAHELRKTTPNLSLATATRMAQRELESAS